MEATEVQEKPTATAEAESYEEHKAARNPKPDKEKSSVDSGSSKQRPDPAGAETDDGKGGSRDNKVEDAPNNSATPKPDRPRRNRDAEAAIANAHARASAAEQERDQLKRELEEARKPKPAATEAGADKPAASGPKPDEDPKPKLADFVAKLKADEKYEDAVERFTDAKLEWQDRQRTKASATTAEEARKAELKAKVQRSHEATKAKYADFDTVTAGDKDKDTGLVLSDAMVAYVYEHPEPMEAAYQLGKLNQADPAEFKRIKGLSPLSQVAEIGALLKSASAAPAKKVPVSKAPEPVKALGAAASAPPEPKSTTEASSYEEHKRLRQKK